MKGTFSRWFSAVPDAATKTAMVNTIGPIADRVSAQTLSTPGLAIKAGASAIVKAGTAFHAWVIDRLVRVAVNTDQAALAGTVTNAYFNVYCFFLDRAGTGTSAMGAEGTTIGAVKFPPIPPGKSMTGFIIVNPTGTGGFVGGTTALDDATVVPNVIYVNTVGVFDPTVSPIL